MGAQKETRICSNLQWYYGTAGCYKSVGLHFQNFFVPLSSFFLKDNSLYDEEFSCLKRRMGGISFFFFFLKKN
jgi:hypothetical protein